MGVLAHWVGPFTEVRSSTGAWILGHVHRVMLVGDYGAAVGTSQIPNTTYNPFYPALIAGIAGSPLGRVFGGPVGVGHTLAAMGWGLSLWAMASLWSGVGGRIVGAAAALALFFPPMVATAGLVRYDTLAMGWVLIAAWAAWRAAVGSGHRWWALAGVMAGWAYNTREFLVGPALGALGAAWLWNAWTVRRVRHGAVGGAAALLGLGLGVCGVPLILGLSPLGGVEALFSYAGQERGPGQTLLEVLYFDEIGLWLLLGLTGLVIAVRFARGSSRAAVVILAGTLLPFAVFPLSETQSSQYYLLGHVLVLSGLAGWLLVMPWNVVRLGLTVVSAIVAIVASVRGVPDLIRGGRVVNSPYHSEAWPCEPDEPVVLLDRAMAIVGQRPLVVVSGRVENVDALVSLRHDRPTAFLFREWMDKMDDLTRVYDGKPVFVLSIEDREDPHALPPERLPILEEETYNLSARLVLVEGKPRFDGGPHPCERGGLTRGACLQVAWLAGGNAAMVARIHAAQSRGRGLLSPHMLWW